MPAGTPAPGISGFPQEEMSRYYRNAILQFKKKIQADASIDELNAEMEHFLNSGRKVQWPHHTSGVFHKDEAEKAIGKVMTEYKRYIAALQKNPNAVKQDLLDSLLLVEGMLDKIKGH